MERWEAALHEFLKDWKDRNDVIGLLACGSYITGGPSSHSDIDLHVILAEGTDWRERGNRVINGFLIEYFANPPGQIRRYFSGDYNDNCKDAATQFVTGRIYLDKNGLVAKLKTEASTWLSKPFLPMDPRSVDFAKYGLWDNLDDLEDACEQNRFDCVFVYHHMLRHLYETYARYLAQPVIGFSKQMKCLSCPEDARIKYLMEPFPDQRFVSMLASAITEASPTGMSQCGKDLTCYVLDALGGFDIDGWCFRSPAQSG